MLDIVAQPSAKTKNTTSVDNLSIEDIESSSDFSNLFSLAKDKLDNSKENVFAVEALSDIDIKEIKSKILKILNLLEENPDMFLEKLQDNSIPKEFINLILDFSKSLPKEIVSKNKTQKDSLIKNELDDKEVSSQENNNLLINTQENIIFNKDVIRDIDVKEIKTKIKNVIKFLQTKSLPQKTLKNIIDIAIDKDLNLTKLKFDISPTTNLNKLSKKMPLKLSHNMNTKNIEKNVDIQIRDILKSSLLTSKKSKSEAPKPVDIKHHIVNQDTALYLQDSNLDSYKDLQALTPKLKHKTDNPQKDIQSKTQNNPQQNIKSNVDTKIITISQKDIQSNIDTKTQNNPQQNIKSNEDTKIITISQKDIQSKEIKTINQKTKNNLDGIHLEVDKPIHTNTKQTKEPLVINKQQIHNEQKNSTQKNSIQEHSTQENIKQNAITQEIIQNKEKNLKDVEVLNKSINLANHNKKDNIFNKKDIDNNNTPIQSKKDKNIKLHQEQSLNNIQNDNIKQEIVNNSEEFLSEEISVSQNSNFTQEDNSSQTNISLSQDNKIEKSVKMSPLDTPPTRSMKNLVEDIKEKINNFKAPLMKVSLEINPQNVGKVDIEIISRANSLYVNFNSNPQAMSLMMNNMPAFKNALEDIGFSNVDMSFNQNSQNSDSNNGQSDKDDKREYKPIEQIIEEEATSQEIENISIKLPLYM